MSKRFLPWDVDQVSLFPHAVLDYVPLSHPAHFVRDLVRDDPDLEAIYASYEDARGAPAIHPAMMTALLLYETYEPFVCRAVKPKQSDLL